MKKQIFAMTLVLLLSMTACRQNNKPPVSSNEKQDEQVKKRPADNKTPTQPSDPDDISDHQLGGPDVVERFSQPMPVKSTMKLVSAEAVVDVLPWSYFTGVVEHNGEQYTILARDTPKGDMETLFSAKQNDIYSVAYVNGSYEQSGKTGLYFTLDTSNGLHWLYRFNLETERTSLVLDTICSEMVLFEKPQADSKGLGWILSEDKILPIRLRDGTIHSPMVHKLEDGSEGMEISNHFWAGIGAAYDTKFPKLTALNNGLLGIEVIMFDSQTSATETRIQFQYNCSKGKLSHIETLLGGDVVSDFNQ